MYLVECMGILSGLLLIQYCCYLDPKTWFVDMKSSLTDVDAFEFFYATLLRK